VVGREREVAEGGEGEARARAPGERAEEGVGACSVAVRRGRMRCT
jgi:hypothetical protein